MPNPANSALQILAARCLSAALAVTAVFPANLQAAPQAATAQAAKHDSRGDAPDNPGPLATDLSAKLTHAAIRKAAKKVADWQLARTEAETDHAFDRDWTLAALYDGYLAASRLTGDSRYHDALVKLGQHYDWKLDNSHFPHADYMALGRVYLDLYRESHDPARMADTKATLDRLIARQDDPKQLLWWWCDALYMAPSVLARMSAITGDKRYLDYMDKEWWETSGSLYDPVEHLYYRDKRYFTQRQANGQKIFWSRGNGWVLGGFAQVLNEMPKDYPTRGKYIAQYKQMAERIKDIQGKDGLWRSGLLDPGAYELPEISGSAFFTYGLAWGIREGILDRKTYEPVVKRAWAGLLQHVYADGRLGSIQPIDGQPGKFKASSSWVFGVGAFLLAASEVDGLAKH